ncbi:MAG: hypothetical protein WC474_11440 [Hydrogenophilaceae bacterium]
MRVITTFTLSLALLLGLPTVVPTLAANAVAATPAETASQVRANWAKSKEAYLASVKSYQVVAAYAKTISEYTAATDKAGATLDQYLNLKLAGSPPEQVTPVIDQLSRDLLAMKAVRAKATGGLATSLGNALSQQNQITQTALSNMR